uniref:treslin isoform X2 n=1 Tax=Pristiophorus japonicus TaxID=55135 RepID=UPI00398ED793
MVSHNMAFLMDTAASERRLGFGLARQAALRVLLHSACRCGFANVRWAFKLFDSAAAARGRGWRGQGFREPRLRQLQELEEALSRESERSREQGLAAGSTAAAAAQATHTALIEALSDYPWDRPDITSPAKSRRGSAAEAPQPRPRSSLFLFAPCPHSRAELRGFLQLPEAERSPHLADRIIPAPLRALLASRSVALHWVDTEQHRQFIGASDHIGYKIVSEVMRSIGGSLIPFAALMQLSLNDSGLLLDKTLLGSQVDLKKIAFENGTDAKEYVKRRKTVAATFPFDCNLNYFLSVESFYRKTFPLQQGLLMFAQGAQEVCCPVTLEPVSCSQKYLTGPVNITLKGAVKNWDPQRTDLLSMHSWVLQRAEQKETEENCFLQRLLQEMASNEIYVVADVKTNDNLPPTTGILSPLFSGTALLTLIAWEQVPEFEELLSQAEITESSQEMFSELSDAVGEALNHFSDTTDECLTCSDLSILDWVQLELAETTRQRISFVEGWFPLSELSGASSTLMESFRSMQAADEKENIDSELALTGHLAEFYQKKSADEAGAAIEHGKKRRQCGPRTPIRQKMRSMSRSLQMLNVARLNVKAQKSQPDGMQLATGDESTQQSKKHLGDKQKRKRVRKSTVDFKSDEEMVSSLKENYQKHVAEDELSQFSFVQNAVTIIKMYPKSGKTEDLEAMCIKLIQMQLLKSSKSIRQQYGNQENKELKVRDCQLQVLLRLEMCQQFPSLQNDREQLEQLVEEMTNLLRIISLTKDTTFLAKFLEEEILNVYLLTVPKVLGELYFGLGQNVPARLASVLPADFFSDESMSQETESPDYSQPASLTAITSCAGCEGEQLEELRTRSSRKRRSLPVTRHRSMSELSHNLRQIQMPKKSVKREKLQSHPSFAIEQPVLPPPSSQKEVQEVTKVRRNLFNRENLSPRKKSKMPKSQSVSIVEGVRHRHGEGTTDNGHRKLLTKKVTETPLHKQVSRRLLHKQIRGRCSESGSDVSIVEESPEKALSADLNLRRSPRIRKVSLARSHSSSFYSGSCPVSRSLERVHSLSQIQARKAQRADKRTIQSPNRLLFGAVHGLISPKEKRSSKSYYSASQRLLVVQLSRECPQDPKPTPEQLLRSPDKSKTTQKSPRTPHCLTPRKKVKNSKSPAARNHTNSYLSKGPSPWKMVTDSQFQSPRRSERLIKVTPNKGASLWKMEVQSPFKSPSTVSGHRMLTSPCKDHSSVKPSFRRSERLASPCRNNSTVNVLAVSSKTVEFASQVKTPGESVTVLNSPGRVSKKQSPTYSIATLSKDKPSIPCTQGKVKLRKSKSDESFISHTPMKCFAVSPRKTWTPKPSKRPADKELNLCSPNESTSQKENGSTPSTPRSIWKASAQTPLETSAMTRSLCKVHTPARLGAMQVTSPVRKRIGFHATLSKSEMMTPSKYTATPPKSPIRTRSMFNVTPSKAEVTNLSEYPATSPHLISPKIRTGLNIVFSKVDQKILSKYNSTPPKSQIKTRSSSTPRSTPPHLKTPLRSRSWSNITSSKHDVSTPSKSRPTLRTPLRSTSRSEAVIVSPEKNRSTIYNVQSKSPKNHKAFDTSKSEHGLQESSLWVSISQGNIVIPNNYESCVTNQTISDSWPTAISNNLWNLEEHSSQHTVSELVSNVSLISERLDSSSLASTTDSGAASSQTEEGSDISQVRLVQSESSGLKMKFAVLRKASDPSVFNSALATKSPVLQKESMSYEFRWTPDRRQRLAAAQQQMPEVPRKSSTPKGQSWPPMPTYEVELEMQDSGLPKLRFKRTNSSAVISPQLQRSVTKSNSSPPSVCVKKSRCESPLGERSAPRCVKHSGKTEGGHVSPSFCFHSSHSTPAKATPRKGGVQTYICQSYTPTQCSSSTSSPSQTDLGAVPWTPSPTHKNRPSQTPDAIKNWPRKKKAATTPLSGKRQKKGEPTAMQKEDNFYTEHYSNKAMPLEEVEMEGVSRLQDQSPSIEWDQRFPDSPVEKFGLRSRKRGSCFTSPALEKEREAKKHRGPNLPATSPGTGFTLEEKQAEQSQSSSFTPFLKTFTWQPSVEDESVFSSPAVTSPNCNVKSTLSASGLLALTRSPLLYTGGTPAKKRPGTRDIMPEDSQAGGSTSKRLAIAGDTDQDHSPFTKVPVRRCNTKTYSRKKLVN